MGAGAGLRAARGDNVTSHWHDYRLRPLRVGNVVLDDQGNCWVVTNEGGYGQENITQCDGIGYNIKKGVAVRLGETFLVADWPNAKYCPDSRKVGAEMFSRYFNKFVAPQMEAELKARSWKGRGR